MTVELEFDRNDPGLRRVVDKFHWNGSADDAPSALADRRGVSDGNGQSEHFTGRNRPCQSGPSHRQLADGRGSLMDTIAPPVSAG
jgi:hypothetical protein